MVQIGQGLEIQRIGNDSSGNLDKILFKFNGYQFEEDVKLRGEERVREEIGQTLKKVEGINLKDLANEGLAISRQISPDFNFISPNIYFVYAGRITDGRVVNEDSFVINLGNVTRGVESREELQKKIISMIAHEGVHIFLKQISPPREAGNLLLEQLWEEGLATFMETEHYVWHNDYVDEASEIWAQALINWLKDGTHDEKIAIINDCLQKSNTLSKYQPSIKVAVNKALENKNLDEAFSQLMVKNNGPLYYLGFKLWTAALTQEPLPKLVSKGSAEIKKWLYATMNG